jgi:putative tricarboxylic transport membrane protein
MYDAGTANPTVPHRGWTPCIINGRSGAGMMAGLIGGCGAFLAWQSLLLDIGDAALPGPGFFPLLLGIALLTIALLLGIECWRSPASEAVEIGHRDVLISIAILLLVPVLFEPAGAPVTLGLFAVGSLVLIGRVSPLLAMAATALGMAACWYFFEVLLGVQLPRGPL